MSTLSSLADNKREIRRQVRLRLEGVLASQNKATLDNEICSRADEILAETSGAVALFHPLGQEPSLMQLTQSGSARRFAFPKMLDSTLTFYSFEKGASWQTGRFGVSEPDTSHARQVDLNDLALICIPGVAFDRTGARLGRGQGFYDRALKDYRGTKVGVAYAAQVLTEALPRERHDVTMDYLVTENYILKVKG